MTEQAATQTATEQPKVKTQSVYTRSKNYVFDLFVTVGENAKLKAAIKEANPKLLELGEKLFADLPTAHNSNPQEALTQANARIQELYTLKNKEGKILVMTKEGEDEARTLLNRKAALEIKLGLRAKKRNAKEQALPHKDPQQPTI